MTAIKSSRECAEGLWERLPRIAQTRTSVENIEDVLELLGANGGNDSILAACTVLLNLKDD